MADAPDWIDDTPRPLDEAARLAFPEGGRNRRDPPAEGIPVTETPEEFRQRVEQIDSKFHEDFNRRSAAFRERAFEYEKLTIEFSHKGFQTLTYLNGGALVAIPTALAFFKADVARADVLLTAGSFIIGLLCVVIAQMAAFFTMSKRAEANQFFTTEQFHRVAALSHPNQSVQNLEFQKEAEAARLNGGGRIVRSNIWRVIGLCFYVASVFAFVAGCALGARGVLTAKERPDVISTTKTPP
jgi:hypothetical protein